MPETETKPPTLREALTTAYYSDDPSPEVSDDLLAASLAWLADTLGDPEVQRFADLMESRAFINGARGPRALREAYIEGLLAAIEERAS